MIPKGIIVHSMGEYIKTDKGAIEAYDFLESLKLSVHGFIHPDGTYEKMIDSPNKAYHAGKSEWNGMQHLNNHFLGFELLVKGEHDYASFSKRIQQKDAYTEEQFQTALEVCKWWMKEYDIPIENVVRHSDVSGDDVRGEGKGKIDVGEGFDWERFKYELGE